MNDIKIEDGSVHDKDRLKELQQLSLARKIQITHARLIEWYQSWGGQCYVTFSGGKDSTVLADLAAQVCKLLGYKLILWFSDTGLEYPEIKEHVKHYGKYLEGKYKIKVDTIIDYPKDKTGKRITFRQVIEKYGYPLISKRVAGYVSTARKNPDSMRAKFLRGDIPSTTLGMTGGKYWYLAEAPFPISAYCCDVMKKRPSHKFQKETGMMPIVGTMASESKLRRYDWLKNGCNSYNTDEPKSKPLSFWTEQDILEYIDNNNLPLASVYGEIKRDSGGKYHTTGCSRTGCIFCGFGCHLEKEPNRFQQLKQTHPKLYDYCMKPWSEGGLGLDEVLNYIHVPH